MDSQDEPHFDDETGANGETPFDDLGSLLDNDVEFSAAALADRDGPSALTPQITVNWRDLPEEDHADICRELADWVQGWLIPRYTVKANKIPDCWWDHGFLIEELSALHAAWKVAFDPADAGWGPIGWHERLHVALARDAFRERCVSGHRPDPQREMPTPPALFGFTPETSAGKFSQDRPAGTE